MTVSRRALLGGAAALTLSPSFLRAAAVAGAPPVGGVHLGAGADASRTAVVSWSTAGAVSRPVLDLGTDGSYGLTLRPDSRAVRGWGTRYHHVVLPRLTPGTTYRYRVRHAGAPPVTGTFRTPVPGEGVRIAAFGDMGVTGAAAQVMGVLQRERPDAAFLVGDLCYANPGGGLQDTDVDQRVWDRWFAQVQPSAARVPWLPAVGNHELESGYGELGYDGVLARFTLPGGGPSPTVWATRYGGVALVALDGNDASHEIPRNRGYLGERQDAWLDRTLAQLRRDPDVDFIVVGFHHCAFSTNVVHASDGGVRERWTPLFDRHGVDLVVNGHNHSYERTHPVRSGVPTVQAPSGSVVRPAQDGTTYVLAGGGGQSPYPAATHPASYVHLEGGVKVPEAAPWSCVRYLDNSVVVFDATPATAGRPARLVLRALAEDGTVVDRVTLER